MSATAQSSPQSSNPEDSGKAWLDRAILIYGPRKAGTTLFQNLLDGSDTLMVYPAELKLKYFVRPRGEPIGPEAYHRRSRIPALESQRLSIDRYRAFWAPKSLPDREWTLGDLVRLDAWSVFCSQDPLPATPVMWCAKEVGGRTERIIALWRHFFPQGKILFIVRDPLAITRAVLNDRRRKNERVSLPDIVRETIDPMRVIVAQSKYLAEPEVHMIAYEDLVSDTESVIRQVAEFLGIDFSPRLLTPSIFGESVVVRTSSRPTTEVFVPETNWTEGLSRRERLIVSVTAWIAGRLPRYRCNYTAVRCRIRERQNPVP
jgi:hypothetical protein